jgi:hypothetical protein
VRRRADRLRKQNILADTPDGLIVTEKNLHRFGNNHHLQTNNMALVRKLLRDLQRCGIHGPEDVNSSFRDAPPWAQARNP